MQDDPNFNAKDRVKNATDIVDLVSSKTNLRRRGPNYFGLCPWHVDKKPSFIVNPVRQQYRCYVCDLHGDVFDFTMETENVDFYGALGILAKAAGINLKQDGPETDPENPDVE